MTDLPLALQPLVAAVSICVGLGIGKLITMALDRLFFPREFD